MQLLCLGDVAFADKNLIQKIWDVPAGFTPGDAARIMLNWEFPLGRVINSRPRLRGMRFCADPRSIELVQKWAPGIATLATNHILDAGAEGLSQTTHLLLQSGFEIVGAGKTAEEIERPLFWETKEGTLGIINWVFAETHPDWMVVPGPNCWPGLEEAKKIIQRTKRDCSWLMVVLHWSDELFPYPLPQDRDIARDLANMGVDLIIGHHPHVVRGMEFFGSCPVFYSLGNCYFAEIRNSAGQWISREAPRNREGLAVKITFPFGKQPQYQLLSFWNTRHAVVPDPRHRAEKRLQWASKPLQKYQGEDYADWYKRERSRFDRWGSRWHFGLMQRGVIRTLQRLIFRTLGLQY